MFLLLFLLVVSPAFGRPSSGQSDVGAEVAKQLEIFTNFNNETGKIFRNSSVVENVVKMLREAEKDILAMQAELKRLELEQIQFEENYFEAFNQAKSYLRETRQGLRKLADLTIKDVRDLKIILGGLDKSNNPIFLNVFINRMKELMVETLKSLKEAKDKYNSAVETFDNLNSSIKAQNIQLRDHWVSKSHKHTDEWRKIWKGCDEDWEFYLIVPELICWYQFDQLDKNPQFENQDDLRTMMKRMWVSGNNFDEGIKVAIGILTEEIELLTVWNKSAKVVSQNIDEYDAEFLRQYKSVRGIFISGLDDLNDAAEEFLKLPKDILELT